MKVKQQLMIVLYDQLASYSRKKRHDDTSVALFAMHHDDELVMLLQ
ncbi:hypothetical protein [Paenibacillus tundrae]